MAQKHGNNYFQMMKEMAECTVRSAEMLRDILRNFSVSTLEKNLNTLHEVEHQGDLLNHALVAKLAKEFITPIEREDIMDIAAQIDDVTDAIEDVLLKISMFNIKTIPPKALSFVDIVTKCAKAMLVVFSELESFKKSKTIHASLVEINHLEEEGDALYYQAVKELFVAKTDPILVMSWMEVYACLEKCCDTCEHTADIVEHIIMKNT